MDSKLLKERQQFLQRAKALPVVERHNKPPANSSNNHDSALEKAKTYSDFSKIEMARNAVNSKFTVLTKIVKYMKQRHLEKDLHPLSVEEILEETMLTDVSHTTVKWLETEALPNNPKIHIVNGKFVFKPKYEVRTKQELYQLLRKHDLKGLGGIYVDDLMESIPNCQKVLSDLGDHILVISNNQEKKSVVFFNDRNNVLNIDEIFKQQWRSINVDGIAEAKIEDYLTKNGISFMSGDKRKFIPAVRSKKGPRNSTGKRPVKIKDNQHLGDMLKDFTDLNK